MKRKHWIAAVAAIAGLAAAVPVALAADTQENTYTVSGKISGGSGATKAKPKAVGINFDYSVGEVHGWRSAPISKYSIMFGGVNVPKNTAFTGCDIKKINDPAGQGVKDCPKASIVGSGQVINNVGPSSDVTNKNLFCYLNLTLVNGTKPNQLLLWLEGSPTASSDPKKNCVTAIHQAIDAKLVKQSGGTALQFNVASNLLHPAPGLDNGISNVTSSIKKQTTKKNGKTINYFQAYQCKGGKSTISVDFTQESGGSATKSTSVACK